MFRFRFGDIAQLVEQMTFNHWVQGSSPCVPTKITRGFPRFFFFYAVAPIFVLVSFAMYLLLAALKKISLGSISFLLVYYVAE